MSLPYILNKVVEELRCGDYYDGAEDYVKNHYLVTYALHHSFELKPISEFCPFPQISHVHKHVI